MASLYEIDNAILECVDPETGELLDFDRFEALQIERERKIENVALWVKNLQADAAAYKAEKDAFADREAAARRKAERLKEWLTGALAGQGFQSSRCAVSFRRSSVVDVLDPAIVPKELVKETVEIKPDKNKIKELLRNGHTVNGCVLSENLNINIK